MKTEPWHFTCATCGKRETVMAVEDERGSARADAEVKIRALGWLPSLLYVQGWCVYNCSRHTPPKLGRDEGASTGEGWPEEPGEVRVMGVDEVVI